MSFPGDGLVYQFQINPSFLGSCLPTKKSVHEDMSSVLIAHKTGMGSQGICCIEADQEYCLFFSYLFLLYKISLSTFRHVKYFKYTYSQVSLLLQQQPKSIQPPPSKTNAFSFASCGSPVPPAGKARLTQRTLAVRSVG